MISRKDVVLLLTDLSDRGVECDDQIKQLYSQSGSMIDILKFINEHQQLDLVKFYEKLRKSYNHKKSKLYMNIVRCDEQIEIDPDEIITTLTSFLNQVLLFKVEDKPMFLKHARVQDIIKVLEVYFDTFDINPAYKLLTLIKADLCVLEYINGRSARLERMQDDLK